MTKYNFLKIIIVFAAISLIAGCKEKPDIGYTSTYKMSGDWYIELRVDGTPVDAFTKVSTYNTSDPNSGQIWFDDLEYWPFKGKLDVDYATLTFKPVAAVADEYDDHITARIVEGKILPNASHSKTGSVVDSIFLKVEFSDDPGTEYEFSGHKRTGFFEDDY